MKKLTLALIAAAMAVGAPAFANEAHHPDQGKPAAGKPAPKASVQPAPNASLPAAPRDATPLTGMMDAMQRQMEQLRNTTDPQEREKLLREHVQAMHETMVMMHGIDGAKTGAGMMPEQRMDMMQAMMEQMIGHETEMGGARK